MAETTKQKGDTGEEIAAKFLQEKGYTIVEKNYRYGHGEIDIIARHKNYLVFVEVKLRWNLQFGLPEEGITRGKVNQVRKTAEAYLYEKKINTQDCRFDMIAILKKDSGEFSINHIENAFE